MNLKCIGGECDGQMIEIDDPKINRPINVVKKEEVANIVSFDKIMLPDVVDVYVYKIIALHFNKDERMLFLIPYDWTDKDAISWQFSK